MVIFRTVVEYRTKINLGHANGDRFLPMRHKSIEFTEIVLQDASSEVIAMLSQCGTGPCGRRILLAAAVGCNTTRYARRPPQEVHSVARIVTRMSRHSARIWLLRVALVFRRIYGRWLQCTHCSQLGSCSSYYHNIR